MGADLGECKAGRCRGRGGVVAAGYPVNVKMYSRGL
jgi:hypothetical protein